MQLKEEGWDLKGGVISPTEASQWLMADASPTAIGWFCRTSMRRSYRRTHASNAPNLVPSMVPSRSRLKLLERELYWQERGRIIQ